MKNPIIVPSQKDYKNMERYLHRKLANGGGGSGSGGGSTFKAFNSDWPTDTTLDAFCSAVMNDPEATVGMGYYGELSCSGLPTGMLQGDVVVEVLGTDDNKVVRLEMSSTNVSPYNWEGSYWQGNFYGWRSWEDINDVYDDIHPAVQTSQPAGGMLPNVLYRLGTLTGTVTIAFAAPSDVNIENEYKFTFDTSSTAPTITWPASIVAWFGGTTPIISASKHYEVSVVDGYAYVNEF